MARLVVIFITFNTYTVQADSHVGVGDLYYEKRDFIIFMTN